jgi:hypothetical protein
MSHGMRRVAYGAVLSAALKDVMKSHSLLDSPHSSSRSQEPIISPSRGASAVAQSGQVALVSARGCGAPRGA